MMNTYIEHFIPQPKAGQVSRVLNDPLGYEFHPLAIRASELLQAQLKNNVNDSGQMFAVLVVQDSDGKIGFLSAYTGFHFENRPEIRFVPSVFDEGVLLQLGSENVIIPAYQSCFLRNAINEEKSVAELWESPLIDETLGSCAAIKLFQFANHHSFLSLAFASFWWGRPPEDEVRHHGRYYPACRGKCGPFLSFMLQGCNVDKREILGVFLQDDNAPHVVYEDDEVLVVDKPAGLLSVPGKNVLDSVLTRLQARYPDATGPLLLHRLDLATSGLLLAAKNKHAHKVLQKQFMQRSIEKRYVAVLSKPLHEKNGSVTLPLRVDFNDRPRQLVCFDRGKSALTSWELIKNDNDTARVYLYPHTGRTHQLRMHAAHKNGLSAPIVGDRLYGIENDMNNEASSRLLLHAQQLIFTHPSTGERIMCESPVPF